MDNVYVQSVHFYQQSGNDPPKFYSIDEKAQLVIK